MRKRDGTWWAMLACALGVLAALAVIWRRPAGSNWTATVQVNSERWGVMEEAIRLEESPSVATDGQIMALASENTLGRANVMDLHVIPTELYPDAVCNDGTPAGFYIRRGLGNDDLGLKLPDYRWLVFLQGGFWCWDTPSCKQRSEVYSAYMTSTGWPATRNLGGIFSTNPALSPFAAAHQVYVPYCSSDAWVGDIGATASHSSHAFPYRTRHQQPRDSGVLGMHFRGQAIVRAVLGELARVYNLGNFAGSSVTEQLYLSGCSAGARGAMALLDSVPALVPAGVQVYGIMDSGLTLALEPFDSSLTSLTMQAQRALVNHNAYGVLGEECRARYIDSPWKCLVGEFRAPFLRRPYFLNEAQYDSFQLYWDLGGREPSCDGREAEYCLQFRTAMREALVAAAAAGAGVFSSACFKHCLSLSPDFAQDAVDPRPLASLARGGWSGGDLLTFAGALAEWMARAHGAGVVVMANCDGFNCGCQGAQNDPLA